MGSVEKPTPYNLQFLLPVAPYRPLPHVTNNCSTIEDKGERLLARRLELTVNPLPWTGGDLHDTQFIVKLKVLCQ